MAESQHAEASTQAAPERVERSRELAGEEPVTLLQRALAPTFQGGRIDPRHLTPQAILALQRTVGNAAVSQLLRQASRVDQSTSPQPAVHGVVLQRWVYGFRGDSMTAVQVRQKLQTDQARRALYQRALAQNMTPQALEAFFQPYVNSLDVVYPDQVFRALEHDLDTREARAAFTPTDTLQGVQIHIQEESTVFPSGRAPAQVNGPNLKISSPQVTFALGIAAVVPPTQLGEWELGIVQTVISADRQLRRRINGAEIATRIWLPSSFNDRGPGVTPPWFDKTDVEELSRPFQLVRMTLYDSPGMNWDQEPGEVVTRLSGRDEFRTWLLLRKKDGSTKQFLKMWSWHVDYTLNEQGPGAGVVFDGLAPHPTGGEAILDGPPATTAYRKEVRQLPRTEFVTSFEQMRRGAT